MKIGRVAVVVLISIFSMVLIGCATQPKKSPKQDNSFELTLKEINRVISSKMPITQKVGENSIKIVSAEVERDGKTKDGVVIEADFVYTSFEIPEGIAGQITLKGKLLHNREDNNLYLYGLQAKEYIFADKKLSEYLKDSDKKLIEQMVSGELSLIPLYHISPKIKRVNISKDKISMTYNGI